MHELCQTAPQHPARARCCGHVDRGTGVARARLCTALAHVNPYAGSPMETRLRMIIVQAGLPTPEVQWVVQDVEGRTAV